jgi:hypothetical protein
MLQRLSKLFKGSDPEYKFPLPDFKGQRKNPYDYDNLPSSKTSEELRYRAGPIHTTHVQCVLGRG